MRRPEHDLGTSDLLLGFISSFIGEGNSKLLQYSCLENPMDRGAWPATVGGHKESDTTERLTHFTHKILCRPALSEITEEKLLTIATP